MGRGAFASCLLDSILWAGPISIAGSWCFLCGVPSVCLPVGSAAGGRWRSHLVRAGRAADVLIAAHRLVSSLSSFVVSSVGSGHHLSPSCDTIGGEAAVAVRLRCAFVPHPDFLPPVSSPCACLPRGVPLSSHDVDGGGRLAVCRIGGLSACLLRRCIRAVPPLVALSFHLMARSISAARLRCPDAMAWVWVRWLSCHAVRHPVFPDCLRSSATSLLKRRGRR